MGCCNDKLKIERLKAFSHASVLACQLANVTNEKYCIVIMNDSAYGEYYEGITEKKAEVLGKEVVWSYEKGDKARKGTPRGFAKVLD